MESSAAGSAASNAPASRWRSSRPAAGGTSLLLRAKPNIRIEPVPALGPRFHEGAPHGRGVGDKGQFEIDCFLTAELCLGGVRGVGMCIDELLPGSRGACLPRLLERLLVVGAVADARQ